MSAEVQSDPPQVGPSPGQIRALIGVLLVLAAGVFYGFVQRGRSAQVPFSIRGRTPIDRQIRVSNSPILSEPRQHGPSESVVRNLGPAALESAVVHVAGEVKNPGVFRVPPGTRVNEAVKLAGGANEGADLDALNLAQLVEDGQKILVAAKRKAPASDSDELHPVARASGTPSKSSASAKPGKFADPGRDSLNLNTANAEQLQRLPGVGPAMADRIIEFRKVNGPFSDPEQLMDVSGVGEKKFAKMRPFVRLR